MVGYFTGAGRIGTLAIVEVAEQFCSIGCTVVMLHFWDGSDAAGACQAVILGSSAGTLLTLTSLVILRLLEHPPKAARIPVARRLYQTAVPLALADDLRTGISTVENLMVPKRLALYNGISSPLAAFGTVCGMVFPILTFPMAILFGLTEILVPELARCNAAGSHIRIRYLARRSLRVALVYGIACGGVLFLLADVLCLGLYRNEAAGEYLRWFALLAPMLYCDAIIDAMNKGLGSQKICVRYNILTSAMDVALLFLWLPKFGMKGYFASFLITHVINAALSLRLLLKNTGLRIPLRTPITAVGSLILAVLLAERIGNLVLKTAIFLAEALGLLYGSGILYQEDALWLRGLWKIRKNTEKKQIK
jgi:stage V sporulation protein B